MKKLQTPNVEPFSNLNAHEMAAVENVVQNLLMDSLGGSSGKQYFSPCFSLSIHFLMLSLSEDLLMIRRMMTLTAWSPTLLMGEHLEEMGISSIPSMM